MSSIILRQMEFIFKSNENAQKSKTTHAYTRCNRLKVSTPTDGAAFQTDYAYTNENKTTTKNERNNNI